tara:strand:+ start:1788 stop:3065 length:1278 start_codon:yes stop_codon:yes gene_type:complete
VLDLRLARENPSLIAHELSKRGLKIPVDQIQVQAKLQRDLQEKRSILQFESNQIGKNVGQKIKEGCDPASEEVLALRNKGNDLKKEISLIEEQEKKVFSDLKKHLIGLPNIPSPKCPEGKTEKENIVIREWGLPNKSSGLKQHWTIAEELGILDAEKSAKIAQSRFITLIGDGARLERSLINFMLDLHTRNGYKEVLPPVLVNTKSLTNSGQLPKFAEESFQCKQDDLWLTPTAEVPITSLHREEILPIDMLPLKYVAFSPCFRREAGSYGKDTRGLIRLHQFNKVELYWFCDPEKSDEAHEKLTADAESVLKALELPYRVVDLCTGDLGFSAQRTFDLEVWLPGAGTYREISSCSSCGEFQARRALIRTKKEKKSQLVHTLNGSGLAIGRTMAAILENGQQSNGSVTIPSALVPYFGKAYLKPE